MANSRQDDVEKTIDDFYEAHTEDALLRLIAECIKDISISLAMLVDK